jgi:hypothetical protein
MRNTLGIYGKNWDTQRYPNVAGPGAGTVGLATPQAWEDWLSATGTGGGFSGAIEQFIEDGGFAKLRELSATFTLDQPFVRSLTGFGSADIRFAGRNLKTWTKYRGLDPEVNNAGAEFLTQGLDWFANPHTRSFVVSINLNR